MGLNPYICLHINANPPPWPKTLLNFLLHSLRDRVKCDVWVEGWVGQAKILSLI